jgi:Skp family chaperone for outer membrane proteins
MRLLFVIVVCATFSLMAQQEEPQDSPMGVPGAQRVEQLKKVRLMELLKLDDETSIRFFRRYNRYQDELREIQRKREDVVRTMESLRRSGAGDADFEKEIQELRAVDGRWLEARDRYWKELREILTVKQFANYLLFENNFNRYLRELMRETQRERMQRMPGRIRP